MREKDESDPNITAPHRVPVTPRTLFDNHEDEEGAGGGSSASRSSGRSAGSDAGAEDDSSGEGAAPFPITAIVLVAVIAGVLGYVAVRQFLSPGSSRPSLASSAPRAGEAEREGAEEGDAATLGAADSTAGAGGSPRRDYFDPLVPAGAGDPDSTMAGVGEAGDPSRESDMVPADPDIPPGSIAAPDAAGEPEMPPAAPPAVARATTTGTAPTTRAAPGSEAEARAEARRGDYARAARLWAGSLSTGAEPGSWTIQVSANCDTGTLPRLLEALSPGSGFAGSTAETDGAFLLPVTIEGRSCYRVCRGIYPDRAAAEAALVRLPRLIPPPQPRAVPLDALLTR